jgi:rhodanese-related sulfurtransferase
MPVANIAPAALSAWLADPARGKPQLLDVREPWEFERARLDGATLLPLRELPARFGELDAGAETVVICHHGGRSMQAALFLERQGFAKLHNLAGGVDAWARNVDPAMPVY